ncbi:aminopeptidase P family protein [Candidatus Gottesmanbacteria bacterium]|nr:aminopeptidase P family protein [Candidatus Gottesmanbacteria bacterium]
MNNLNKIREDIKSFNIDSIFITNQQNVSYLTGFVGLAPSEREGFLFITLQKAYLLTFPTYFGLYEKGGDGFITVNITQTKRLSDHLAEILGIDGVHSIGVEKENLTVAELNSLKAKLKAKFVETEGIVEKQRLIKNKIEIQNIKKAAEITDLAFEFIKTKIIKGITEKNLALELEFFLKKTAGDIAFSPIVAFDENAAIPHYLPTNNHQLTTNNLILLDFGARVNGYCSDMTRVVFLGKANEHQVKIYETVLQAQRLALESVKNGILAKLPDKIAREYIKSHGLPDYPHGLGHGVGLAIHERPRLRIGSDEQLLENMVVTVEPGIYLPGDCGVRIEDLVVLRKDGIEILSKSSKELIIL